MAQPSRLPPGQRETRDFFRFGLPHFARRFPANVDRIELDLRGDIEQPLRIAAEMQRLVRVEQVSDFHCVTTWTCRSLAWSGYRFADFYREIVLPLARPKAGADLVIFRGQDGYASILPLADLLATDVLLADRLGGADLGVEHGAPIRLIAPAHYGYKNVKHIAAIEFWRDSREFSFAKPYPGLMHHPRARVALEERGVGVPAFILRVPYRLLIPIIRWQFRHALEKYRQRSA